MSRTIRVNSSDIPFYPILDTDDSLLVRIAVEYDTIPKYLIGGKDLRVSYLASLEEKKVIDIISLIKGARSVEEVEKIGNEHDVSIPDLISIWVNIARQFSTMRDVQLQALAASHPQYKDALRTSKIKYVADELESQKQKNIHRDRSNTAIFTTIYNAIPFRHTPFQIEKVRLEIDTNIGSVSLLELFNYVHTNPDTPFCYCQNYYKILKTFVPPVDWAKESNTDSTSSSSSSSSSLRLKLFIPKNKEYIDVTFDVVDGKQQFSFDLNSSYGLEEKEYVAIIDRALDGVDLSGSLGNTRETKLNGTVFYPGIHLNNHVFSDMVLNNSIFSQFMSINESRRATKQRTNLYIHFFYPTTGNITVSLSGGVIERQSHLKKFPFTTAVGTPYIHATIKGDSKEEIDNFLFIFSRLLHIYNRSYQSVVADYREYIPDFASEEGHSLVQQSFQIVREEEKAPPLFVANYSRKCGTGNIPNSFDISSDGEEEKKRLEGEGYQVIKFPRDYPGKGPHYPSDGKFQKYYYCGPNVREGKVRAPGYVYPGIRRNLLPPNKDYYPYVPCCYKEDNRNRNEYRTYYHGDEPAVKSQVTFASEIIRTQKILHRGKFGVLPPKLENMFNFLDLTVGYTYRRTGVFRDRNSFISCVHEAMRTAEETYDEKTIEEVRNSLANDRWASVSRQNNYNDSILEIKNVVEDQTVYFSPKRFIAMLEVRYGCKIYIFNRDGLMIPNYTDAYYTYRYKNQPVVFVYEHLGAEADEATYPQCELIVKQSDDGKIDYTYTNEGVGYKVWKMFSTITQAYTLNKTITPVDYPLADSKYGGMLQYQKIDSYGKSRACVISIEGKIMTLITDPIPPLLVDEKEGSYPQIGKKTCLRLCTRLGIQIIGQKIQRRKVVELVGRWGNVTVYIPVKKSSVIVGIEEVKGNPHYIRSTTSALDVYNHNKKIARYLVDYMYWLFSRYLHQTNTVQVTDEVISEYTTRGVVVDPEFDYKYIVVRKTYTNECPLLDDRQRLIVTSDDMKKRLLYLLRLYARRNLASLLSYRDRTVIENYFLDLSDFKKRENEVIIYGDNSVEKWIYDHSLSYHLVDHVLVGRISPYFFRNNLIGGGGGGGGEIFLAQNVWSLDQAISLCLKWYRSGYNNYSLYLPKIEPGYNTVNFIVYNYLSPTVIHPLQVIQNRGGEVSRDVMMLGYKIGGVPRYTCLFKIGGEVVREVEEVETESFTAEEKTRAREGRERSGRERGREGGRERRRVSFAPTVQISSSSSSSSPSFPPSSSSPISKKILVVCQRLRSSIPADQEAVARSVGLIKTYIQTYIKDNVDPNITDDDYTFVTNCARRQDAPDCADYNFNLGGDNDETKAFIDQYRHSFDVIVLYTCPFVLMDQNTMVELLKAGGKLLFLAERGGRVIDTADIVSMFDNTLLTKFNKFELKKDKIPYLSAV